MSKYLDDIGLAYFWNKIKAEFAKSSHTHDSAYLSKGGGEVTGDITITTAEPMLDFKRTDTSHAYIRFLDSDGTYKAAYAYDYNMDAPRFRNSAGTWSTIWHSGNFNPSDYLSKISANRPGTTKLYRYDHDSGYSVQTYWDGAYWVLRGHNADDSYHAPCRVGVADNASQLTGLNPSVGNAASTIAVRDSNGYLQSQIFQDVNSWDVGDVQPYYIHCGNTSSSDRYHRRITFTNLANRINGYGSTKNTHGHNNISTAGTYNQSITPYGNIQFGPMNTGAAHIYTDRSQIYLNKQLTIDANLVFVGTQKIDSSDQLELESTSLQRLDAQIASYDIILDNNAGSYSESTLRPDTHNKCNLGGSGFYWYMTASYKEYIGSNSEYKDNILPYDTEQAYEDVKNLPLYTYQSKDSDFYDFSIGALVQDMPIEMVNVSSDDANSYDSNSATFMLWGAVQILQKKVEMLEHKISEMEAA